MSKASINFNIEIPSEVIDKFFDGLAKVESAKHTPAPKTTSYCDWLEVIGKMASPVITSVLVEQFSPKIAELSKEWSSDTCASKCPFDFQGLNRGNKARASEEDESKEEGKDSDSDSFSDDSSEELSIPPVKDKIPDVKDKIPDVKQPKVEETKPVETTKQRRKVAYEEKQPSPPSLLDIVNLYNTQGNSSIMNLFGAFMEIPDIKNAVNNIGGSKPFQETKESAKTIDGTLYYQE